MLKPVMRFCSSCGASVSQQIPAGDNRLRDVCDSCGKIHYQNPRMVAGTLPVYQEKVLLCKRAINPRKGFWTLPGGFVELDETLEQGALRETVEEAGAEVRLQSLYTLFNVLAVGQVSVFFLSELSAPVFSAGEESLEVQLFSEDEIPWQELAFDTIAITLEHYFRDRRQGHFPLHMESLPDDHRLLHRISVFTR